MNEVKTPKKPLIVYYAIAILVVLLINTLLVPMVSQARVKYVDYGTFIQMTEEDKISEVQVQDNQIIFVTKEDEANKNAVYYRTGKMDDPELTSRLSEHGVRFDKEIVEETSPLLSFLLSFVFPIVLFIALGQLLTRQMMKRMGGGKDAMSFGMGNSNAKVYVKDSAGSIKFDDVAGEDEAKENLSEIVNYLHDPSKYRDIGASMPKGILLVGPPGTGKTSCALKKMVETFYKEEGAQILLLSYTNRAVDEICKALSSIRPEVDFIRVGSELSCDENYRDHLIENELATCMRRTEVCERINRCRILVGTVASISGKPELFRLKHFDVAIVDEATQILEPQLLGILCAKGENGKEGVGKFILIGDHKQLPAVVLQNTEQSEVYDEALSAVGLKNLKDSLFERLYRTARQHTDAHRTYDMLCRQGRMHPEVALFANQAFYEGRLLPVGLPHQLEDSGNINRLSFYPSQPEPMGSSAKTNHSEAKIAARLAATVYKEHSEAFDASRTLGIITPYRSQIALVKKEIEALGIPELNQILIDTVERFQGSERDVIIYSFCVNYPYQLKFLSNLTEEDGILIDRKLNVALTRARKQMLLTGVPTLLERNPLYKSLLKLIESLRNIA